MLCEQQRQWQQWQQSEAAAGPTGHHKQHGRHGEHISCGISHLLHTLLCWGQVWHSGICTILTTSSGLSQCGWKQECVKTALGFSEHLARQQQHGCLREHVYLCSCGADQWDCRPCIRQHSARTSWDRVATVHAIYMCVRYICMPASVTSNHLLHRMSSWHAQEAVALIANECHCPTRCPVPLQVATKVA